MLSGIRIGLRLRLTAAFAAVAVTSFLSAGYFTVHRSYKALKLQKQQDELVMAKNISAQVQDVLIKAKQTIELLAQYPAIKSMDVARQQEALTSVTQVTELIDGMIIVDLKGNILVLDKSGPDVSHLIPDSPYQQFVALVKKTGKVQFLKIYKSKTGDVAAAINAPIYHGGKMAGVLSGGILLTKHDLGGIARIRIGRSGYAYIVDGQGHVVADPQTEKLLENVSANTAVRELLDKREGVTEFINQEGVQVLAAFAPIKETGWGVVVSQLTSESYALADQILYFIAGVFFLSLAGALAIGVFFARRVAKPVDSLVQGVKQVAEGRLDLRITASRRDEIGELAEAFNNMTVKLKSHMDETTRAYAQVLQTQKQLAQSEKMAAIGQLTADLAHEIYNPLNIISGFSDYLIGKRLPEDVHRHLEDISRETYRCQKLVAELLNFAKPKELQRVPADINQLVQATLALVQNQIKSQGVVTEANFSKAMPSVSLDRDQIKQVLINLLVNACQAMPQGGTLSVRTARNNGHVEIAIQDTGTGIAAENLENIFHPFFTTKKNGTGLGLTISYALVKVHGGRIEVKSKPGQGTEFIIVLPVERAFDG